MPPDTEGDIGPNHYVQWINLIYAVWTVQRDGSGNPTGVTLVAGFPKPGNVIFSGFGGVCETLNDGDASNDPFIIDARKAEDYTLGHIAGAVKMGSGALADEAKLAMLPTDKQIVVYCYTGQTSSQMTSVLNMLGYDATNMKFGMPAWALIDGVSVGYFDKSMAKGYKFSTEPATLGLLGVAAGRAQTSVSRANATAALGSQGQDHCPDHLVRAQLIAAVSRDPPQYFEPPVTIGAHGGPLNVPDSECGARQLSECTLHAVDSVFQSGW